MNDAETKAALEYVTTNAQALPEALAIRTTHWSTSGIVRVGQRREIEVGRSCELMWRVGPITRSWALIRRPQKSTASLVGAKLVPDVAGVYVVTLTIAGLVRTIELVAIAAALADLIGPADGPNDRLKTLRGRLNDGRTTESIIAALETSPPTWGDLASPAR
jgi:hypothetical protein